MQTDQQLKDIVKQKYSEIALQEKETNVPSCCSSACCSHEVYNIMTDNYSGLEGYAVEADLGLGCGLPTQFAQIKPGDTVIDLGSGAGNDVFIARAETGEAGKVIGIDFTPAMIEKARANTAKLGFTNVEFRQGDIEQMPVEDNVADVIVSNCVLNLVPNKKAVISEISRVLKPGAHFSIADIVLKGDLPKPLQEAAEMYAGCVSGAIQKDQYLQLLADAEFEKITVQKERQIILLGTILQKYFTAAEPGQFINSDMGIYSITVYAKKPAHQSKSCCGTECCN